MAGSKNSPNDEGKEYVVIKADNDISPPPEKDASTSAETDAKEEDTKAPEILYKVQYKDYSG